MGQWSNVSLKYLDRVPFSKSYDYTARPDRLCRRLLQGKRSKSNFCNDKSEKTVPCGQKREKSFTVNFSSWKWFYLKTFLWLWQEWWTLKFMKSWIMMVLCFRPNIIVTIPLLLWHANFLIIIVKRKCKFTGKNSGEFCMIFECSFCAEWWSRNFVSP